MKSTVGDFFSKYVAFTKFLSKKCEREFLWKFLLLTVWKNKEFTVTQKFFRQITSLVFSLVKKLFSRNFCQKCVRINVRNFHVLEKVDLTFIELEVFSVKMF